MIPTSRSVATASISPKPHRPIGDALGAAVGNVSADALMEVVYHLESNSYTVFGCGARLMMEDLEDAKEKARELASESAKEAAVKRGAREESLEVTLKEEENIVQTEFDSLYMGYKVTATGAGNLNIGGDT